MPQSGDRPDPDAVADVVRAVHGVVALHPGMFGEVGTYLPGRRVTGVRLDDDRIEVHVVLAADAPIRETAAAVRDAVFTAFPTHRVDVTVEDVASGPRRSKPTKQPRGEHLSGGTS